MVEPCAASLDEILSNLLSDDLGCSYRHDRSGRLIGEDTSNTSRRFWFDRRNRITRVHTQDDRVVHHAYDALGRLAETTSEIDGGARRETFYWDGNALARRVVVDLADDSTARDERYTFDPEQAHQPLLRLIERDDGPGDSPNYTTQYYTTDPRGAAVRLTDEMGAAVWTARYDPFGGCAQSGAEAGEQPIRLLGQVFDESTGLAHHRFRVYDPQRARFMKPDPLGLSGGPNGFAYPCDPNSWADPLGLKQCRTSWQQFLHDNGDNFSNGAWRDMSDAAVAYRFRDVTGASHADVQSRLPEGHATLPFTPIVGRTEHGAKFAYTDGSGSKVRVHYHEPDLGAPAGSNAANGWVVRVQRRGRYMDGNGTFHHKDVGNENSPNYDPAAANATHIPIDDT
jgi:RHS repeat-associated protein